MRRDFAVEEYERAITLNPNFAAAHGYLGFTLSLAGRTDQAIAHLEQAMRMSPHDPQNATFNNGMAVAHYLAGRYVEATASSRREARASWDMWRAGFPTTFIVGHP